MQRDVRELFSTIVRTAKSVQNDIGPERKVYPLDKILKAFEISRIDYDIRNYRTFQEKIPGAIKQVNLLESQLDKLLLEVETEHGYKVDPEFWFDAMDYLDITCLKVKRYIERSGEEGLCYPWRDRIHIEACFRHYHTYKFLENHIEFIGRDEFLKLLPDLECFIIDSGINDIFYWDIFDTGHLYEAEEQERHKHELKLEESVGSQ